ncbi:MAG: ROK family protein [Bacteroidales bacterium]|jgi:glucokinase|nr:ROK family protein [Bacteroidales bacterium]
MKYTIGIDIGGTNTIFGLVDENGTIVHQTGIKTRDSQTINNYLDALTYNIQRLIEKIETPENIIAVGVGAPNGNAFRGTIEYAPNLPFEGVIELKKELEQRLLSLGYDLKVYVTNDANAAAIGEMMYGKAKDGVRNFIMITLGTGVGSGIVADGKLIYGHTGFAGEIGHTKVSSGGRKCKCGKNACAETYASASGIVKTVWNRLKKQWHPSILAGIPFEELDVKLIADAALKGDKAALFAFELAARKLAVALANAVAVTSPEKIYLFGGIAASGDLLLKPLRAFLEKELYVSFKNSVSVELSGLQQADAAILGAAALGLTGN